MLINIKNNFDLGMWGVFMYPWIDEYVLGVFELCGSKDIYEICDYLGILIKKIYKSNNLLRGNDAFYFRDYFGSEIIFIRDDLSCNFEKFILAHELGHAIMHVDFTTAAFNNLINEGKLEKQANYFAFKLLDINIEKDNFEQLTIDQISNYLEIPSHVLKQIFNI